MLTFYERADWMLALIVAHDLSKQACALLVLYVARADAETGSSHLSQGQAAERLHASERTVRRAKAELVDKGVIAVRHRRHRSSIVTLVRWSETGQQLAHHVPEGPTSRQDNSWPRRVRPRGDSSGRQEGTGSGRKRGQLLSARTEPVTEPENRTTTTAAAPSSSVVRRAVRRTGSGSVQTGQQLSGLGPVVKVGDTGVLPDGRRWEAIAKANPAAPPFVAVDYEDGTPMGNYDLTKDGRLPATLWEVGS